MGCKPNSVSLPSASRRMQGTAIIHLGTGFHQHSSGLPGNSDGPSFRRGTTTTLPYLTLLRMGFTKPARRRTAGALLPHLFTLTHKQQHLVGGVFSVALSVPYGPPDYEAHCPAEFGLSSPVAGSDCPPFRSADTRSIPPPWLQRTKRTTLPLQPLCGLGLENYCPALSRPHSSRSSGGSGDSNDIISPVVGLGKAR